MNSNLPPGYIEPETIPDHIWEEACERFYTEEPTEAQCEAILIEQEMSHAISY